jgi:hypothetical protein
MKITIENQTVTTQAEIRPDAVPDSIDFFEARHRLVLEGRQTHNATEMTPRPVDRNSRRGAFLASANLVDEALYWFISAPALVYVIYLVFGL